MKKVELPAELVSERLVLKPVKVEFAPEIFPFFTDEVTKYMFPATPRAITDTEKFLREGVKKNKDGTDYFASIFNKETDELVGGAGLHHIDTSTPEIGIWIKTQAHGHKYGLEAVAALKKWADANLDYEYLIYPVVAANIPSRRIPEALGGVLARHYRSGNQAGHVRDMVEYRIYKPV